MSNFYQDKMRIKREKSSLAPRPGPKQKKSTREYGTHDSDQTFGKPERVVTVTRSRQQVTLGIR